jgi:hypothetical protein
VRCDGDCDVATTCNTDDALLISSSSSSSSLLLIIIDTSIIIAIGVVIIVTIYNILFGTATAIAKSQALGQAVKQREFGWTTFAGQIDVAALGGSQWFARCVDRWS